MTEGGSERPGVEEPTDGTRWQRAAPNGHAWRSPEMGVNGTASRHIMMSETARLAMNTLVMVPTGKQQATK